MAIHLHEPEDIFSAHYLNSAGIACLTPSGTLDSPSLRYLQTPKKSLKHLNVDSPEITDSNAYLYNRQPVKKIQS